MNNEDSEEIEVIERVDDKETVMNSSSENHPEKRKKRISRFFDVATDILFWTMAIVMGIGLLHYGRRIFIAEKFIIPTYSMYPTLIPGDRIMVNKLYHGARLYSSFDFSDHAPMEIGRASCRERV